MNAENGDAALRGWRIKLSLIYKAMQRFVGFFTISPASGNGTPCHAMKVVEVEND